MRRPVAVLLLACAPRAPGPSATPGTPDAGACEDVAAPSSAPCRDDVAAAVVRVVDGDTLDVEVEGAGPSRVRLIGIDAPEHDEGACGAGAQEELGARAPAGTDVRLAFDAECRDAYERDLAYVSVEGRMLNAEMLRGGFAQACPFSPNTAHAGAFACLAARAAATGEGLWSLGCHRDECFR